jgi:transcriptional regulator with GAF, ATPase, and Fis domain
MELEARRLLSRVCEWVEEATEEIGGISLGLQVLSDAARILASTADVKSLLEEITSAFLRLVGADRGLIVLKDKDEEQLEIAYDSGVDAESRLDALKISTSVVKDAVEKKYLWIVPDTSRSGLLKTRKSVVLHRLRAVVCVPLGRRNDERALGAIYCDAKEPLTDFTDQKRRMLITFGYLAGMAIDGGLQHRELRERDHIAARKPLPGYREADPDRAVLPHVVGSSHVWKSTLAELAALAALEDHILILGEPGVGKSVCARFLHFKAQGLPDGIISFDVSEERKIANFLSSASPGGRSRPHSEEPQPARKGTLLIQHWEKATETLKRHLRRHLRERQKAKGVKPAVFRGRVILELSSASHDGASRTAGIPAWANFRTIYIPPLRERLDDIDELAAYFIDLYAATYGVELPATVRLEAVRLRGHSWKDNIRELDDCVKRAVLAFRDTGEFKFDVSLQPPAELLDKVRTMDELVDEFKTALIKTALSLCDGNVSKAAELLGKPESTVRSRSKSLGITNK